MNIRTKIRSSIILLTAIGLMTACNNINYSYDASGTFEATEVTVSSEANGRITSLDLREGETVEKGAILGQIDTIQLDLQKKQLYAGIEVAKSKILDLETQIAPIKEQISNNEKEKSRIERLVAANAANQKDLDDINSALRLLNAQLTSSESQIGQNNVAAEAEINSLNAQIDQINDQIARCRIKSPIDGNILVKYAEEGELTAMGKPLFKVADIENMNMRAYITAGQLTMIRLGQKVKIYADAGNSKSKEYEGVISWISDKSEFTPKTIQTKDERANLVYAIKIDFKNDGYIKIGMYGDVKF